jgi:hypothetical protein
MSASDQALRALSRYEDGRAGLFEEFAEERLGPGRSLALLAGPLGERRQRAWAICPTVGPEHGNLRRLEAVVARRLAAQGFETLRIRPDADPVHDEISPETRAAELEAGIVLLRERGASSVGGVGVLYGATLAALTAGRAGLDALALVQPVVRGRQYARELVRREAVAYLHAAGGEGAVGNVTRRLDEQGTVGIRGLELTKAVYDELGAVDLVGDLTSFDGRSLLVAITPTGEPGAGVEKLAARLHDVGGDVVVAGIPYPLEAPLGEYYYRDVGLLRIDTRLALDEQIAERIATWALEA